MRSSAPARSPGGAPPRLEEDREAISKNLSHAFAVQDDGAFKSLLQAIDDAERKIRH